tara:strand:+ start:255 stop:749 length:495 start_codon:yes stop_codon:yes gene_type:complete
MVSSYDHVHVSSEHDFFELDDGPEMCDVVVNSVGKFHAMDDLTLDVFDTDEVDMLAVIGSDTTQQLMRETEASIEDKKREIHTLEQQLQDLRSSSSSPYTAKIKRRRASSNNMRFRTSAVDEDNEASKRDFEASRKIPNEVFLQRCILQERDRVFQELTTSEKS